MEEFFFFSDFGFSKKKLRLDLFGLKTILEVVEVGSFTVPLAEDDLSGVVVGVVGGHVGVEELPVIERGDNLLDESLSVDLELLDFFVGLAEFLHLLNNTLQVALDVGHVGGLFEGGLGEGVVVDDVNNASLLGLSTFTGGTFFGVFVNVGRDTVVFVSDFHVLTLDDEHTVFFVEDDARVAEDFSVTEVALEDLHVCLRVFLKKVKRKFF